MLIAYDCAIAHTRHGDRHSDRRQVPASKPLSWLNLTRDSEILKIAKSVLRGCKVTRGVNKITLNPNWVAESKPIRYSNSNPDNGKVTERPEQQVGAVLYLAFS